MAYDVVIFDLDGTLLDTLDDLMDSCNYALSTIGAPPRTRAEIRRFVGNGIRNLMLQAVPDGADNPKFEQAYETMQTWYKAHNQIKTAPYPGVQRLIRGVGKLFGSPFHQQRPISEAPGDGDAVQSGIGGCGQVYLGIAYIHRFFARLPQLRNGVIHHIPLRLPAQTFPFPQTESDLRKPLLHQHLYLSLIHI